MSTVRKQIANLTDEQIIAYVEGNLELPIRMGFELEFQGVDGKNRYDFETGCHGEHDYDWDAVREEAERLFRRDFCHIIRYELDARGEGRTVIWDIINQAILNNWDLCSRYRPTTLVEWYISCL